VLPKRISRIRLGKERRFLAAQFANLDSEISAAVSRRTVLSARKGEVTKARTDERAAAKKVVDDIDMELKAKTKIRDDAKKAVNTLPVEKTGQ